MTSSSTRWPILPTSYVFTTYLLTYCLLTYHLQGEPGDKMYIIKSGEVEVLVDDRGEAEPLRKIDHLYRGRCFGERALVKQETRMAHLTLTKTLTQALTQALNLTPTLTPTPRSSRSRVWRTSVP